MADRSTITRPGGIRRGWLAAAQAVLSLRGPQLGDHRGRYLATLALRIAGAVLLGIIGYIHWHLWQEGYKFIATNGPLFLVDAIAAVLLAVLVLAWARPLTGVAATGFTVATIGALVISLQVGLFGFHESIHSSFVVESLVLESIAAVILAVWTVIAASAVYRRG